MVAIVQLLRWTGHEHLLACFIDGIGLMEAVNCDLFLLEDQLYSEYFVK